MNVNTAGDTGVLQTTPLSGHAKGLMEGLKGSLAFAA